MVMASWPLIFQRVWIEWEKRWAKYALTLHFLNPGVFKLMNRSISIKLFLDVTTIKIQNSKFFFQFQYMRIYYE